MVLTDSILDVVGPTGALGALIAYWTYKTARLKNGKHNEDVVREAVGSRYREETIAEPLTNAIAMLAAAVTEQTALMKAREKREMEAIEKEVLHEQFTKWLEDKGLSLPIQSRSASSAKDRS